MVIQIFLWLFLILIGLFGVICIYFIGWHILASVAPDVVEKFELKFVLRDIKRYFGFLFEMGYEICEAEYSYQYFGNWSIQLQSQNCVILIVQDRSDILVSFASRFQANNLRDYVGLEQMIFLVTQGQVQIDGFEGNLRLGKKQQFERISTLLREYIDLIQLHFSKN